MKIIVSKKKGFCAGVRRAVEMMERFSQEEGPIETLGTIVHNPQVVELLASKGVTVADSMEDVRGGVAAITAHGMGPQVEHEAKRHKVRLVDATCPIVKKVHLVARDLAQDGYDVVIFGDPKHQEVKGIADWAGQRVMATNDWPPASGHGLALRKIAVLSQTTQGEEDYRRFIGKLMEATLGRAREVRVINTICGVTDVQKAAARELSLGVDLVLVVGGRTSANTRHLAETCARAGVETHHIETAAEIDPAWLAGKERVGITAGTSTPDWVIEEVVAALETAGGET